MIRLVARGLVKRYGATRALNGLDLDVASGGVVGVAGPNGAGKSTLMRMLAGEETPDSGEIVLQRADGAAIAEVWRRVAVVHQEPHVWPNMTVAQNLELGQEKWFTVYSKINIAATQALQSMNFNVDPLALVETLGAAKRQMVEIVRAVRHNAEVFIFDEPTATLTPEETQHLFHLLNVLKERGAGMSAPRRHAPVAKL